MTSSHDVVALRESHSWLRAIGLSVAISMCIAVDILQYSFPLSFLPRSLEDEGHSSRHIAAVIGGYYWSGFAGGVLLTVWQIYKIFVVKASPLTLDQVKMQIVGLIVGLLVGAGTLLKQANDDSYTVHMVCRVIQGFLGAILFFYSYLLSIELFTGKQQIFALTLNTISLNVAEVGGPLLGATVFTVSGKSSSFYFLTAISFVNQVVLLAALAWIHAFASAGHETDTLIQEEMDTYVHFSRQRRFRDGLERLVDVISSPLLWKSLAVIAPSALIKAEIENILPLFADHSMGYNTMHIGYSFSAVAVAFVISSISIGLSWDSLSHRWRDLIVGSSLVFLCIFSTSILPLTKITQNETVFMLSLGVYGVFLGLTITPSSFLLGEFVDSLKDSQSKDVANGIWNTLWEMGGSVGFFISGIPRSNDWKAEELVISSSSLTLLVACVGFFLICEIIRFDKNHLPIIKAAIEDGIEDKSINVRE
jgi:predicted MFS family arabinose efflux permease